MSKYFVREKISENDLYELKEYPELMQELLFYRGVKTANKANEFLNPNYDDHIHNPFLMKDMEKAVKRILSAVDKKEKIIIYSDYDCDGIPGGVILYDFFKKIKYENVKNYIPHRHKEGYGFHKSAIEEFAKERVRLIITVDCGITDANSVDRANELGINVIITDHHLPAGEFPNAYAIINPKQNNDEYPYKDLSGAGVAFKLAQGIIKRGDFDIIDGWEKWLLDMVAIATVADMTPLLGENRCLAYYGIKVLRKSPRVGLMKLCRKIKINQQQINEDDIGFMLAPRINAASRMDMPYDAFKLFITNDEIQADELSDYLNKINNERKGIVASIVKEIKKRIENLAEIKKVIVMGNPLWRPTLLGLAANSIVDEYEKPVFLWGRDGRDILKGSCRSDGSVNLVKMMEMVKETFIAFGGHAYSGGFSITNENIYFLEDILNKSYIKAKEEHNCDNEEAYIDKRLEIDDINWNTYGIIEQLAPFGLGNPKPLFLFENIKIAEIKHFGKDKNHLQLDFKKNDNKIISAIGFFKNNESFDALLEKGEKINLIASIEKSTFRNFPELRLRIVDIL
ncbi:single-stranded-DNA-specific exonuclease RecJ [Candidatus Campbellbacteria bacterium CG10_big_fil_rev_8_21_14_0_10_35_52]|uniref:Single-stranded-DNA-specific exonuclease RecJ n=1 Tax=Candidatus Campbellbacteria bacterium CG10_big_fil_rev_8_21_14_0_10_35_52 TaxID=1974527 RepID=A0A2M6WVU2_9BACT|nr:MAG: single-stranded-DNA-specific exonuclease RecJ [Candidatus Campbellbacteria bacterium CG10_big_fil_rev_8_21_14_0_10_35_52]